MRLLVLLVSLPAVATAEPATDVHLGAEVGGGRIVMLGESYGSFDLGIDLAVDHWVSPQLGVGLRLGQIDGTPVRGLEVHGDPVGREMPWLVEPRLLARTAPTRIGPATWSWVASVGAGPAWLRTVAYCGGFTSTHNMCEKVLERSTALEGSLAGGGAFDLYHVHLFAGPRVAADTAGDRDVGLVLEAGGAF